MTPDTFINGAGQYAALVLNTSSSNLLVQVLNEVEHRALNIAEETRK